MADNQITQEKQVMEEGRITDEALRKLDTTTGKDMRIGALFNQNAVFETMRNFCWGEGDRNPLYQDEEYGKKTRYGKMVAHPAWLYSIYGPGIMHGLPGVHAFHAGCDWHWFLPVLEGDKISPRYVARGYEEKKGHFAARQIKQLGERIYNNQRGELVARADTWVMRVERAEARKTGKYAAIQLPHPWTDEQIKEIEDYQLKYHCRGPEVRYWEDVKVGETVGPLVKGPLGLTDEFAWHAGGQWAIMKGQEQFLFETVKHPSWCYRDYDTWRREPIAAVHYNVKAARGAGLPYPYDVGMQRNSWVIQMFTDWMGDEGWLKRCYCEYRLFNYFSDVIWITGKVTKTYQDDKGEYCVDIDVTAPNQRKENTTVCWGTVILPSRNAKTWPVANRLPKT